MLFANIFVLSTLFLLHPSGFLASPTPSSNEPLKLSKRANPAIGASFTSDQVVKIQTGFKDACAIAVAASKNMISGDRTIFRKYFLDSAFDSVVGVFANIVGGDPVACSKELADITIRSDFPSANGSLSCVKPWDMGETRGGDSDNPIIILCPPGLAHPGIADLSCDDLLARTTWRMETLGSIILHEYTHVDFMVAPPLGQRTTDFFNGVRVYGPVDTQSFPVVASGQSEVIADSYTWFANEAYWSQACAKSYALAEPNDDEDPLCNNESCQEEQS